jgi:N-acetylmuramoyl-L-alanine amidase
MKIREGLWMKRNGLVFIFIFATAVAGLWGGSSAQAKPRIVLDAAHGGADAGVKSGSQVEKDWNQKFAQALAKAFEAEGYEVVLIRKRDESLSLDKRVELANTSQASAVIVVHAEREWTGTQKGPFVVVEPPSKVETADLGEIQRWGFIPQTQYRSSLRLARSIAQALGIGTEISSLSDNRGLAGEKTSAEGRVHCLPHQSLRYLTVPALVLTPMFLSSPSDAKKYSGSESLANFAAKVVRGTNEYFQITP